MDFERPSDGADGYSLKGEFAGKLGDRPATPLLSWRLGLGYAQPWVDPRKGPKRDIGFEAHLPSQTAHNPRFSRHPGLPSGRAWPGLDAEIRLTDEGLR